MGQSPDIVRILGSNHPAKPYLVVGGLVAAYGLLRSGASAIGYLLAGGYILSKGFDEIRRIDRLHGGNYHGTNAPSID